MEIKVTHGIPKSPFFVIAQPKRQYPEPRIPGKTIVELEDPKTKEVIKAEYHTCWDMEEEEFTDSKGFAKLVYGCGTEYLKRELKNKYPELDQKFRVEYWLLKKI